MTPQPLAPPPTTNCRLTSREQIIEGGVRTFRCLRGLVAGESLGKLILAIAPTIN